MVKANVDILINNSAINDIEIKGSRNEVILEISLILMRIKANDNKVYEDILNSMEIINSCLEDGIDVDELQDMVVKTYLKTLKKGGK